MRATRPAGRSCGPMGCSGDRESRAARTGGRFRVAQGVVDRRRRCARRADPRVSVSIARFDADGFRIDTLKFIEAFARVFGNAMRESALTIGQEELLHVRRGLRRRGEDRAVHRPADARSRELSASTRRSTSRCSSGCPPSPRDSPARGAGAAYERRKEVEHDVLTSHGEARGSSSRSSTTTT